METKGASLAAALNRAIDRMASDTTTRTSIIGRMGSAAGISASTVNQILNNTINCPPIDRLRGFARALSVSLSSLRTAAESDGCSYGEDGLPDHCILKPTFKTRAEIMAFSKGRQYASREKQAKGLMS